MSNKAVLRLSQEGAGSRIIVDGEDISSKLIGVEMRAAVGQMTELTLYYGCYEIDVDSDTHVIHVCPLVGEGEENHVV